MPEYVRWLLPLLRFPQVIILLSILLLLCLVLGRFILKVFRVDKYLSSHFAVNISIYVTAGFIFATLVLNIIAIFAIGTTSLIIFLIITALAVFILWRCGDFSLIFHKVKNLNWSLHSLSINMFPLILIVLTLCHFSEVIEIMGWPTVGDVMWGHGPFTSLLLYNGKITSTLEPLSARAVYYPTGFHTVAANFASWFNLFPVEAIFLAGGLIAILLPLLIYSLTNMLTKSIPLSLLTYSATFIVHPYPYIWAWWMMGIFYGAACPNLLGLLVIFFLIAILSLEYAQPEKVKKQELYVGSILTFFLSSLVVLLVYPSFIIFVAIMLIFILLKHYGEIVLFIQKRPILISYSLIFGFLFVLIVTYCVHLSSSETVSLVMVTKSTVFNYVLSSTFLFDHITGYVMLAALPISIILLFRKKYFFLSLFYVLVFCVIVYTLSPFSPEILYLILPGRAIMIPWVISWIIIALGVSEIIRIRQLKKFFDSYTNISIILFISISAVIILPQFTSSLVQEFSYANAQQWGWYVRWDTFPYDYAALLWINYNVPPKDLILIDKSVACSWILSFSVKNVTYFAFVDSNEEKRATELQTIWDEPYNYNTVYQLLEKYNVSYIFVSSDPVSKPFAPSEYEYIFDNYPFLKVVFRLGDSTVYKVDIP